VTRVCQVNTIAQISVAELNERIANNDLQIVDVRRPGEYVNGHVPHAQNAPLASLEKSLGPLSLEKDKLTAVICAGGIDRARRRVCCSNRAFQISSMWPAARAPGSTPGYPTE
jgi:3-mercaptopyruvate sulfurtransferase SseA